MALTESRPLWPATIPFPFAEQHLAEPGGQRAVAPITSRDLARTTFKVLFEEVLVDLDDAEDLGLLDTDAVCQHEPGKPVAVDEHDPRRD